MNYIDLHCDTLYRLYTQEDTLPDETPWENRGHIDLSRLHKTGACQVLPFYYQLSYNVKRGLPSFPDCIYYYIRNTEKVNGKIWKLRRV